MILIIDNYDSFVHNLARYFEMLDQVTSVHRHDEITLTEIEALKPSHIVISPGPGTPIQAGITLDVIKYFAPHIPILGVCLGHQAIGHAFGATVCRATYPMHGKASEIYHTQQSIFSGIATPLSVGRYHSLIVKKEQFPNGLEIIAESQEGEIMALRHHSYPLFGVQFHPESILTTDGLQLINNFIVQQS